MNQPESRELRYFVAVAEELHFGRAAERLGISQPPLSRAISQLEHRIGVPLLDRTTRNVALTPAGESLLRDARMTLDMLATATRRARRAGQVQRHIVLAMEPGGDSCQLAAIMANYDSSPHALPIHIAHCSFGELTTYLRDGRADIGFIHLPQDDATGLDTENLATQPQVAVVHHQHPLAQRASVTMAELQHAAIPTWTGIPSPRDQDGPRDLSELMARIALGHTIAIVPNSIEGQLRRDLRVIPVTDAQPSTLALAWPDHSHSAAVAAFVRAAVMLSQPATVELVPSAG